jgi:uncharacterized protein (DUF2267 family)
MAINFDKFAQEGHLFINNLSEELGHPDEKGRVGIIARSVMHTLRDRITISESLDVIAQLPMFLKAIYVDNWKYMEKPLKFDTVEEFSKEVEKRQEMQGEQDFDWNKSTEEIAQIVFKELGKYLTDGEAGHVIDQLPKDLKSLFEKSMHAQ